MKLFACILALYILALTTIPCSDRPQGNAFQKVELSQSTTGSHQHNTDHCSPFCACNCCATTMIYQNTIIQFDCFSYLQKYLSVYTSAYVYSVYATIWQPPKLS